MAEPNCQLRQICLAAADLKWATATLAEVLELEPAHYSQEIRKYGLENVVFPVNGSFVEIVSPVVSDTSVGRFLNRGENCGGYMLIFETSDLDLVVDVVESSGLEIVAQNRSAERPFIQLHPRDMGITLVQIDQQSGNGDRFGDYSWCGEGWQKLIRTDSTVELTVATIVSDRHVERAKLWSEVMGVPLKQSRCGDIIVPLDYGSLVFKSSGAEQTELFRSIVLTAHNPDEVISRAEALSLPTSSNSFLFCGLIFEIERLK